jgi:hypothetical protein
MFTERLSFALTLTIQGKPYPIKGGDVKLVELDLGSSGFTGAVEFVVASDAAHGGSESDALLAAFLAPDLVTVSLTMTRVLDDTQSSSVSPLSVTGLGRRKTILEHVTVTVKDHPVLLRRYRVELADPAAVLWTQHFPTVLYTQTSVKDALTAQVAAPITLTYDSQTLGATLPLFFLHLPPSRRASFYDFVLWYVDAKAAVWIYDYAAAGYKISDAKDTSSAVSKLPADDVERATIVLPEVLRASAAVLNSYSEAPKNAPAKNAQAVDKIRRDYLLRSPIAQDADDRLTLETKRLVVRQSEVELTFRRLPTITFQTGLRLTMAASDLWSSEASILSTKWRVYRHRISARASDGRIDANHLAPDAGYDTEITAWLEQDTEAFVHLPPFAVPSYPGYVEGKVVSAQGADTDITYQVYTDEKSSIDTYEVNVPLWQNQTVHVPFEPQMGSGNVFIPAYKNERVLLAIDLTRANVVQTLDWRADARANMTMAVQGEQLFFGKTAQSNTAVNHAYDSSGNPVFNVARVHDKDTATIQIKEGALVITVKENP